MYNDDVSLLVKSTKMDVCYEKIIPSLICSF